jgi:hypothetical protein
LLLAASYIISRKKSIPKGMNPFLVTIFAYVIGIVLCAICAVISPGGKSLAGSVKESNWAILTLGVGVAAIELGFLLSYRAGWKNKHCRHRSKCGHDCLVGSGRYCGLQGSTFLAQCGWPGILYFRFHARNT